MTAPTTDKEIISAIKDIVGPNGAVFDSESESGDITRGIDPSAYWVGDRGFGRRRIIEPCLRSKRNFIFRLDGKLDFWFDGKACNTKEISRQVILNQEQRILKKHRNQ